MHWRIFQLNETVTIKLNLKNGSDSINPFFQNTGTQTQQHRLWKVGKHTHTQAHIHTYTHTDKHPHTGTHISTMDFFQFNQPKYYVDDSCLRLPHNGTEPWICISETLHVCFFFCDISTSYLSNYFFLGFSFSLNGFKIKPILLTFNSFYAQYLSICKSISYT